MLALGAALCVISTMFLPSPPAAEERAPLAVRLKATLDETRELLRSGVFLIFLATASF
jgi:hypothetical protein